MDWTYHYGNPQRLYLNVTNRCTNRCGFCVRNAGTGLGDGELWGGPEPSADELRAAIDARGGPSAYREFIWCGFGEPTLRLDLIMSLGPHLQRAGARVRLDTNGHGNLIHGRKIIPDLTASIDDISISLNAATAGRYVALCRPDLAPHTAERIWAALLDFIRAAADAFDRAQVSVVGSVLTAEEIEACEHLARSLGITRFRVRGVG